ncbi:MAG: ABC transporter substrate-binding protein [Candidatus Woesearchaeota archaeon]
MFFVFMIISIMVVFSVGVMADNILLGFSQLGSESAWRVAETKSIRETALDDPEVDLLFAEGNNNQENQLKAIDFFIEREIDVMLLAPVVETGWDEALQKLNDANIPVILVDRGIEKGYEDLWDTIVGNEYRTEGQLAAEWIIDEFNGKANVVELKGTKGSNPAIERKKGFEDIIADAPDVNVIASEYASFERSKGREVMEAILNRVDPNTIDVVYAHNDGMALGALQAIEDAGLKPGEDIFLVGIDGVKDAFKAMMAGKYNLSIESTPLLGPQIIKAAKMLYRGEEVERYIFAKPTLYTQDEATEAYPSRVY